MTTRLSSRLGATAACALALAATPAALAQRSDATTTESRPRSQNERVATEAGAPSTINRQVQKDEAAAEGARTGQVAPNIPPGAVGSSSVPAPAPVTGTAPGTGAPLPAAGTTIPRTGAVVPGAATTRPAMTGRPMTSQGHDVAMLVEHSLAMAIEATALQAIAEQGGSPDNASGPPKELLDHARRELQESRDLLTQASADGRGVAAGSPTRRFYDAANAYVTSLSTLSGKSQSASPADKAQVVMVNHSVKEVLDANHLNMMGRMFGGSAATEQLLQHARHMKDDGTQNINRIAGNAAPAPPDQPTPALLAQQGRALIEAADQLAAVMPAATGMMGPARTGDLPTGALVPQVPGGLPTNGENPNSPGRFQDPRPEIIGGTYSTGSREAGTVNANGVREALRESVPNTNPEPNTSNPNAATTVTPGGAVNPPTNSRGGLNPR